MKPSVTLAIGTHITAADKRNIVETISFLERKFACVVPTCPQETPDYGFCYCRRAGSKKKYAITPRKTCAGTYDVRIRANETTDIGRKQTRAQSKRWFEPTYAAKFHGSSCSMSFCLCPLTMAARTPVR